MKEAPKPKTGASLGAQLGALLSHVNSTQQFFILTALLFAVTGGIGVFAIQIPWNEKTIRNQGRYGQEQERSSILMEIQRAQSRLREAESGLLLTGGAPALTGYLSALAGRSGIQIDSVTPQPETSIPPYSAIELEIIGTGSLDHLLQFLRALEEHRPLLTMIQMEVGNAAPAFGPGPGRAGAGWQQREPAAEQPIKFRIGAVERQGPP